MALVNKARTERGLPKLVRRASLDQLAEQHAKRMRAAGRLYHNGKLPNQIPGGWRYCGENVGYSSTVVRVHRAFMNSPAHRANILRPAYDEIGIGVVWDSSGRLWQTQVFVDR